MGHAQIFKPIFGVAEVVPSLLGFPRFESAARALRGDARVVIGVNPHSGDRWKSKELRSEELLKLLVRLSGRGSQKGDRVLVLLGSGGERHRNLAVAAECRNSRIIVPDTDDLPLRLAAVVRTMDYLITSDSLALHLAIAQGVPFLAFFAPTSAAEIDDFGIGVKLLSTSVDYCSYRQDADNRTITASRIVQLAKQHKPHLFA